MSNSREYIIELLKYKGEIDLVKEFEKWTVPKFPVSGNNMKKLVPHPKMIGQVMNELKAIWLKSDFKLGEDELLKFVPEIVDKKAALNQ